MYVEKKKIGKNIYNYLKVSVRTGNKVTTKTIAYLGKNTLSKSDIIKKIAEIPKAKIEKLKEELKKAGDLNKDFLNEGQFKELERIKKEFNAKIKKLDSKLIEEMFKDFKIFYIYNTTAIEGNTLTLEETNLLLNENKSPEGKDLREIYDHINERETFDFILKNEPKISKESIIKIHSMLLNKIDKRVGSFRRHNVRVLGAAFDASPWEYVDTDISIILRWYNKNKKNLHPLILAAIFHEKFERIHPFYYGNGRTGRMIANLILIHNGFPPFIVENKKRKEYYNVLSAGHNADLTKSDAEFYKPIVQFFYSEIMFTYDKIFSKWG